MPHLYARQQGEARRHKEQLQRLVRRDDLSGLHRLRSELAELRATIAETSELP